MMNVRLAKASVYGIALFSVLRFAVKSRSIIHYSSPVSSLCTSSSTSLGRQQHFATPTTSTPQQIAITIMLTQADSHERGGAIKESLDGAATLRQSILQVYNLTFAHVKTVERMVGLEPFSLNNTKSAAWMKPQMENVSVYSIQTSDGNSIVELRFIALVNDDVELKWRNLTRLYGYEVWKTRTPLDHTEVRNEEFAYHEMKDSGAIGSTELIKLEGLRMKDFDTVFLLDCDVLFHKRFDELFRIKENHAWTRGGYVEEKINGGYLIFNPQHPASLYHHYRIIDVLKEGDFRPGSGWRGSGIGWGWGGPTIQGILPYYYFMEATKEQELLEQSLNITLPPAHVEIDRCKYNNMVQTDRCTNFTFQQVTSNHFTSSCAKPWYCEDDVGLRPLCDKFRAVFGKHYKELILEHANSRSDMQDSEVVKFAKDLKDGDWCVDGRFVSLSAFLGEKM